MTQSSLSTAPAVVAAGHDDANKKRLFVICVCALVTTSMSIVLRSSLGPDLQASYFDAIDKARGGEMYSGVLSAVFLTFAIALAFGGALIDLIGMRTMLILCAITAMLFVHFVQPADAGVIANFKVKYNRLYLHFLMSEFDKTGVHPFPNKKFNIRQAIDSLDLETFLASDSNLTVTEQLTGQ